MGDVYTRAAKTRAWLTDNPEFYSRFCNEAYRIWRRGWRHYSARTLIEVLRHHSALEGDPEQGLFKINNNLVATLAHDFMEDHPHMPGFFELRRAVVIPRKRKPFTLVGD